jgi:hypothetical protein
MTFEMVRMGWPNTGAIVALAIMPVVALATMPQRNADTFEAQCEVATLCPPASAVLATLVPDGTLE